MNLIGTVSNRNGIGARVQVVSALGSQIREIRSGDGFKYMSSLNAHFGIGTDSVITGITVRWPSGIVDELSTADIDGSITITEGMTMSTSIADGPALDAMEVFPNPVLDVLTVTGQESEGNGRFQIMDVAGKLVLEGVLSSGKVDVSSLSDGVYVLSVKGDGQRGQQRFVKQ